MSWPVIGSTGDDESERSLIAGCRDTLPTLFSFVYRLLEGDSHHAEDIIQEAILRCWLKYGTADRELLRPWLFTVARNLVTDTYRRNKTRPVDLGIDLGNQHDLIEPGPEDAVLSAVTLKDALLSLPPTHREVLYRTYFLEKTDEEVARELGLPRGTVKSRRFYGIRTLRLALTEPDATPPALPIPEAAGAGAI
ncbi:sigma-70 family RNA polymerase sigma factor [Streptomyces sp. NPDC029554]|uniref:sigma-70 family RNA polymerase sigma factor n=1 Tax=Streptomyces sp. NPDC029554 TaxID=3155126 RepID=UPI0034096302